MKIELDNGKYTYIFNDQTGESKSLRYGEEWQDLTGDSLVLAMAQEIERLRSENKELIEETICLRDEVDYLNACLAD